MRNPNLDRFDEAEAARLQRDALRRVREFLVSKRADDELLEAVDQALVDIDQWIDVEVEVFQGVGGAGTA